MHKNTVRDAYACKPTQLLQIICRPLQSPRNAFKKKTFVVHHTIGIILDEPGVEPGTFSNSANAKKMSYR